MLDPKLLLAVSLAAVPASAQLQPGDIVSTGGGGNVVYNFTSYPANNKSTGGFTNMRVTGASGQDHTYHAWWWWRLASDTEEFVLSADTTNQAPPSSLFVGDTVIHSWPNVDNRNIAATLVATAISTGTASGSVYQQLSMTNNTGAPITLNVFSYVDNDFCGTPGNDSAAANPTGFKIRVRDVSCSFDNEVLAVNADGYDVTAWSQVRGRLADTQPDTLGNAGLPFGPGDFTCAHQWRDRTLQANETLSVVLVLSVGFTHTGCTGNAQSTTYGSGKAGTNGVPVWSTSERPLLGTTASIKISSGLTGSFPVVFLASQQANIPFPPFGTILFNPAGAVSVLLRPFNAGGDSDNPVQLPNTRAACGASLYLQGFFGDPGAAAGVAHTGGLQWTFGGLL